MRSGISRADMLRGRFIAIPGTVRPPYAVPEADLRTRCERCDDCRDACQTGIIGHDSEGFPILLFGQAKCSFCGACAAACTTGALSTKQARAWTIAAHVKGSCMSFNGVACRTCEESCAPRAIRFAPMTGGRMVPIVDEAACTGCGACAVICPNQSMEMTGRTAREAFA